MENMDLGPLLNQLKHAQEQHGQTDDPNPKYLSFVPQQLRSNVVLMTSQQLRTEVMSTLFLGTIRPNYREEMWSSDVQKWQQQLGAQPFWEIKMLPINVPPYRELDAADANTKVEAALNHMNKLEDSAHIRIICLGTGYAAFLYQAITYLLKEWRKKDGHLRSSKYLQFYTSGDSADNDLFNFCKWLCISGTCETVEFYNTQDYRPFGYCKPEYR